MSACWRRRRRQRPLEPDRLSYLARINLFADMDREALALIDGISPTFTVPGGTIIARPDEETAALYLLKRGRVRLYKLTTEGRMLTLAILKEGNVFGVTDMIALGSEDMYAEAVDDVLLCAMRRPELERLMRQHPEVGLRLIEVLSQRVRDLEALVASIAHEDVQRRVVRLLLQLADDFGVPEGEFTHLDLPLTHEELASMIGSTRETVTATLSHLAQRDIVRTGRREISLHSVKARDFLGGV